MRYYTILVFLLIAFVPVASLSQSVGLSEAKRSPARLPMQTFCSFGEQGSVVVLLEDPLRPLAVTLLYLDGQGAVAGKKEVPLGDDRLPAVFERAFRWGDRLTILTSVYYPGPRRNNLLLRQYAVPSLEEVASMVVDEVYMPMSLQIPFGAELSPDSTRLLCYGWSYTQREDSARLSLTLLDRDLRKTWDREYLVPYRNETFFLHGMLLNRQGGVYVLAEDYEGRAGSSYINQNKVQPLVLYVDSTRRQPLAFPLRPDDKTLLPGLRITLDAGGALAGAGFYQGRNRSRHDGVFTFSLDGPSERLERQLLPVDQNRFNAAAIGRPSRQPFEGFTVDDLWVRPDGTLILTAESVRPDASGVADLVFGDILVMRLPQGRSIGWMGRLPREQGGAWNAAPLLSFSGFYRDTSFFLLYGGTPAGFPSQTPVILAEFSETGLARQTDLSAKIREQGATIPVPALCWDGGGDRLALFGLGVKANQRDTRDMLLGDLLRSGVDYTADQYQVFLVILPWTPEEK